MLPNVSVYKVFFLCFPGVAPVDKGLRTDSLCATCAFLRWWLLVPVLEIVFAFHVFPAALLVQEMDISCGKKLITFYNAVLRRCTIQFWFVPLEKLEMLGSIVSRLAHYDAVVNLSTLCNRGIFWQGTC